MTAVKSLFSKMTLFFAQELFSQIIISAELSLKAFS
jgi:hypothetical protein